MGDVDCGTVANTPHHQSYLTLTKRQDGLVVPTLVRPELTHVQKFVFPDREKDEAQLAQLRYSRCGPLCSSVFSSLSYYCSLQYELVCTVVGDGAPRFLPTPRSLRVSWTLFFTMPWQSPCCAPSLLAAGFVSPPFLL